MRMSISTVLLLPSPESADCATLSPKGEEEEPEHIEGGEERGKNGEAKDDVIAFVQRGADNRIFAPETREGRYAGDRQIRHQEAQRGDRHKSGQAAHLTHVLHTMWILRRDQSMDYTAGSQEQQGLEEGVGKEMVHA